MNYQGAGIYIEMKIRRNTGIGNEPNLIEHLILTGWHPYT